MQDKNVNSLRVNKSDKQILGRQESKQFKDEKNWKDIKVKMKKIERQRELNRYESKQ